jgi:RES domain-containing protein
MTPEDQRLDQSILREAGPLKLYRIARSKYANLSGVGAALYPGRWNQLGEEAIYTSTHPSTPVLERLVHTPKDMIPTNLAMMELHFDRKIVPEDEFERRLQRGSEHSWFVIFPTLKFARENYPGILWTKYSSIVALAVPSVIVPEWNVVLYPQCDRFWDIVSLKSVERFEYDERLFPENTPKQISD